MQEVSDIPARRLVEADLLRVAAMVSVIVVHTVAWMDTSHPVGGIVYPALDRFMRFGVPIFVFLTGYVLVHAARRKALDPWRFTRERIRRVVIPFVSWMAIYLAVYLLVGVISVSSPAQIPKLIWDGTVAGHLYFLAVACQFYLVYLLLPRSRRSALVLCAVAVPFQLLLTTARAADWQPPAPLDMLFGYQAQWFCVWWIGYYALGVAAAWYREPLLAWLKAHRRWAIAAPFLVGPAAVMDMWSSEGYDEIFRPSALFLSVTVMAALMLIGTTVLRTGVALGTRLELLAQRSLGVYLVHPLVLLSASKVVQSNVMPLNFSGRFLLTLPTLLIVIGAVLGVSLAVVGLLAWLPGGWLVGGRHEGRTRTGMIRRIAHTPAVQPAPSSHARHGRQPWDAPDRRIA